MTWIENINNINNNQDKMVLLNNNHNGKVIFLDSNKVYDTKTGNMLKTGDNKYVSKKVIKNKNNKLVWRHIFSYLNMDNIEKINQYIYMDIMKHKVFGIKPSIEYITWDYICSQIVEEVYDCRLDYRLGVNENRELKKQIKKKEEWVVIEYNVKNNATTDRREMLRKNMEKISLKYTNNTPYFDISYKCKSLKKNGEFCLNSGGNRLNITDTDYQSALFSSIECCGVHINQFKKLNAIKQNKKIIDIQDKLGYKMNNGIVCKVCN